MRSRRVEVRGVEASDRRWRSDLQVRLLFAANDEAGAQVDLASAVRAVEYRAIAHPRLRLFANQSVTAAGDAIGADDAALDGTEHLPIARIEEPKAAYAV